MARPSGLRERKKAQMRQHLADTAARLFAERGFDGVSMVDVAREADVSDQTVYNYFPAKHDLVLDMTDEFRERYSRAVRERAAGSSPAIALLPLALENVERFRHEDPVLARGEFPALNASSPFVRRFALEAQDVQTDAVAAAIMETAPSLHPVVARAHSAALMSVIQLVVDRTGRSVLDGDEPGAVADALAADVRPAFAQLDRQYRDLVDG